MQPRGVPAWARGDRRRAGSPRARPTPPAAPAASPRTPRGVRRWPGPRRWPVSAGWWSAVGLAWALLAVLAAEPAHAQTPPTSTVPSVPGVPPIPAADPTLDAVITNLRNVLVGLAAGLATLFLVVGGLRYQTAGSDPGQVEKAKGTLKYAAAGYAVAALAPVLVGILRGIVGA